MPSQHTKPRAQYSSLSDGPMTPGFPLEAFTAPLMTDEEMDRMVDAAEAKEAAEAEEAWLVQVDPDVRAKHKAVLAIKAALEAKNTEARPSQSSSASKPTRTEVPADERTYPITRLYSHYRAVGGYQAGGGFLTEEAYTAACSPETSAAHSQVLPHSQVKDAVTQAEKRQRSRPPIPDYHPIFAALKGSVF